MLSKPKHGWSKITIGNWSDRCSYLDDVPFMLLNSLEQSCRMHKPVSVKFDAEGYEYIIIFDWFETHIISDKEDDYTHTVVSIDRDELAKELISDILNNLPDWASWYYCRMTEDQIEERKKDLTVLCEILERRLPSDDFKIVYKKED